MGLASAGADIQICEWVVAIGRVRFREVFVMPYHEALPIGTFLVLLKQIRYHGLGLESGDAADDIWVVAMAEGPAPGD
jgi:hypothetical protein